MTTIFRKDKSRITIEDAKRLILEATPMEMAASIYARIKDDGEIDFDGPVEVGPIEETNRYAPFIDREFASICAALTISPTMRVRPSITGFPEAKTMDGEYTIAHDEFCRVADGYQLLVEIGEAPQPQAAPAQEATTTAPVVTASDAKPWLSIDQRDPAPSQSWYTPARYFARQLVIEKPALLANRELLADQVSKVLFTSGFKKRGGKLKFDSGTVLKAFANVTLG